MTKALSAVLLVASIAFATAPFWSGGFAGFESDQFPVPQIDPPVQPAGYAFSIWGVIYLWLIGSAAYGFLRHSTTSDWSRYRWPLIVSLAVGATWLSVAQASPVWATVLIWLMLATALLALKNSPREAFWGARYSVELYAGWLTAASSVSIGLVGAGYGIGPGAEGWALIALGIATCIAVAVLISTRPAPVYAFGVAWALVAVVVANASTAPYVATAAGAGCLLVVGLALATLRRVPSSAH